MTDPCFFGYGSLVNRRTHAYARAWPATLPGWRREWRATRLRPAAFLTAARDPGAEIDGLIAEVPGGDWAALDMREAGYAREAASGLRHTRPDDPPVAIYAMAPDPAARERTCAILLSYLDVVVQGFAVEFGEAGVERFFGTTGNWHLPVADDRAAPLYPRHQKLAERETALVDDWLVRLSVRIVAPDEVGLGKQTTPAP